MTDIGAILQDTYQKFETAESITKGIVESALPSDVADKYFHGARNRAFERTESYNIILDEGTILEGIGIEDAVGMMFRYNVVHQMRHDAWLEFKNRRDVSNDTFSNAKGDDIRSWSQFEGIAFKKGVDSYSPNEEKDFIEAVGRLPEYIRQKQGYRGALDQARNILRIEAEIANAFMEKVKVSRPQQERGAGSEHPEMFFC
jgi:hypothetical protein